ncbi:MAG: LytR/AlgR family response regulator transcription factor [Planctomycetota bacterium]|jgi:DNA-binding LytR/AlgR family response regulator
MAKKIRCIVVDDEPLARKVLKKYIDKVPSLELAKQCANAMEAAACLHELSIDLIFIDMKMPEMTGMDFIKTLSAPPKVIVTTAYSEYALEGYEHAVIDYLLKPISFERFLKAVNRILEKVQSPGGVQATPRGETCPKDDFVFLWSNKTEHKVKYAAIRYVQACGNSVEVHMDDEMIPAWETMTTVEESLPKSAFIRVHKSFIVAIDKIDKIEGNKIRIGEAEIPIGKHYKRDVTRMVAAHRFSAEQ